MRTLIIRTALVAGAALALAGCNRAGPATNNVASNELDANMTMGEPANDASAMESTTNMAEPPAPAMTNNSSDSGSGSDVGGDTGGNNVESNTLGM